jgi:hypothetical protein
MTTETTTLNYRILVDGVLIEPNQNDIVILPVTVAVDMMAHPKTARILTLSKSSEQEAQLNED